MKTLAMLLAAVLLNACASSPEAARTSSARPQADFKEAARINTELGTAYTRNNDLDLALDKFNRAIEQEPDYAPAHAGVAFVYVRRGDSQRAEEHYRRALKINPDDAGTRNNFGVFLCGQNRGKEAENLFLHAAKDSGYAEPEKAYTNAGVCARKVPDLDKAEAYFRKALELRPEFGEALAQMASLCVERRDYLRARAFLQRYEKVGPPTAQILAMGSQVELALGDKKAAADYATRLKTQFPESEENRTPLPRPAS
ncbi:MAG: type IV pilus biogenesis/stability protein PilW [Panacagrimonas sp.]